MFKLFALLSLVLSLGLPKVEPEIWAEPVPFLNQNLVEDYLAPVSEYSSGHRGIDLYLPLGEPVFSPATGTVHFVGKVVNRNLITIKTESGKLASFEPVCSELVKDQVVLQTEQIGTHCKPDESYEYHCESCIHHSVRDSHGYLSPMSLYGILEPSVLKN